MKKEAAVYRSMAQKYERETVVVGTCDSLRFELGRWPEEYARLFSPTEIPVDSVSPWYVCVEFGDQLRNRFAVNHDGYMASEQAREFRILALCFMAAISERP